MSGPTREDLPVRVAVLGCGNVGGALVEMLADPARAKEIALRAGVPLELVGIATRDGTVSQDQVGIPTDLLTADAAGLVSRGDVDVVVELIGGIDPAKALVESALSAGRPVVT